MHFSGKSELANLMRWVITSQTVAVQMTELFLQYQQVCETWLESLIPQTEGLLSSL